MNDDKDCILISGLKALTAIAVHTDQKGHLVAHMCDVIGLLMVHFENEDFEEGMQEVITTIRDKHKEGLRAVEALKTAAKNGVIDINKKFENLNEKEINRLQAVLDEAELPSDDKITPEQRRLAGMLIIRSKQ